MLCGDRGDLRSASTSASTYRLSSMRSIDQLLFAIATITAFTGTSHSQTVLYQENFNSGCTPGVATPVPSPLITHNVDGRTPDPQVAFVANAWVVREDFKFNTGNCAAFSTSYYTPLGAADDWLVLPPITAAANTQLSWKAVAYDPNYPDGYEVRVSTTGSNPSDFTQVLLTVTQEQSIWMVHQLSLAAFAGQTIRIAFRNNANDQFLLLLDDLVIQTPSLPIPANVAATKTVSGPFTVGSTATYTVVLTNTGPGIQADNPGNEFTDVLPAGVALVSASASSGTAIATAGSNTVTWNGSIPAGGSVTLTIAAKVTAAAVGTVVTNQGTVAYDSDGNGTNDATRLTDDPTVGSATDPTSFTIAALPVVMPKSIPTLSEWGVIGLSSLMAMFGLIRMRRQRI